MRLIIKFTGILILSGCLSFSAKAQLSLAVNNIPDSLTEDANSVYRFSDQSFEISSNGKGVLKKHYGLTILNSKAKSAAEVTIPYSNLRTLKNISANVYDAQGNLVHKLKKSEIRDYSNFDGFSVYSDSRLKHFDLRRSDHPYTIEVSYEIHFDGLMSLPVWIAQSPNERSVQLSTFTITTPEYYQLRMKVVNLDDPKTRIENGQKIYNWKVSNLKPSEWEPRSADPDVGYRMVYLAPSLFEMEGYAGDLSSWESFGKWYQQLNSGRDDLLDEDIAEIRRIVAGATDKKEKIRKVYEYLQKNTRYVSIQLGIGGWQTFPASYVAENGFGDCKALTNYTSTVLKKLNISSYYTLVNAGKNEDPIDADFPSNQFNHVILCVPVEKDTVWLECTSQTNPFGFLGKFTSDRDVLVLNESGGKIVRTPSYSAADNRYLTKGVFEIDKEGNGSVSLTSDFSGLSFDMVSHYNDLNEKETMKLVRNMFPVNNLELTDIQYSEEREELPKASLKVDFNARKVARVSGKRMFLVPNQINRTEYIPSKVEERTTDFEVRFERNVVDSITFRLPQGIHPEFIPKSKKIESEFGTYEVSFEKGDGYLKYYRRYVTKKGVFDKKLYGKFIEFNEDIAKADKQKVVFMKST